MNMTFKLNTQQSTIHSLLYSPDSQTSRQQEQTEPAYGRETQSVPVTSGRGHLGRNEQLPDHLARPLTAQAVES